jgi:hypothetical protein
MQVIINLARETNAPELLPSAFYDLSRYTYAQIFEASPEDPLYSDDPRCNPSTSLSADDMRRLALGKEAAQQAVIDLLHSMARNSFRDVAAFGRGAQGFTHVVPQRGVTALRGHARGESHTIGRPCTSPAACRKEFEELVELARQHYVLDGKRGSTDPLYVAEELGQLKAAEHSECKPCARSLENWARRERERMWKLIPVWFRLES